MAAAQTPAPAGDPMPVVHALQDAMGGKANWEKARFLRFDWTVERNGQEVARVHHLWDRWDGRYRVEWRNKEGKTTQALFNVNTKAGRVWVDGQPVAAADSTKMLERAYGRFINDSYWLLMPAKLEDPKVKVESLGRVQVDGQDYDLLHVTFDHVGLTPGDQYWAWVNTKTHMLDRWAYFLEGTEGTPSLDKATVWAWSDWQKSGGVMLARDRRQMGADASRIWFPVCEVLPRVDDQVFTSLATPMPDMPPAAPGQAATR